ncbi:uncharacterized protein LOC110029102 [Phalaenopsis equestris]|uniref:uncharacterized protein LOC110029102 n=1 Tax=Phalaenopsis equestris TaxID=78828 RepID=UPI0009E33A91|nr:uncharacterized protein LOC110029102 [Phalaenopsis equestris]
MATASLPPRTHPTLLTSLLHSGVKTNFPTSFQILRNPNPSFWSSSTAVVAFASSSSWEHEEQRWLREEQRWLREEQRWLREELRWSSEREALLREIAALRLRIDALEGERSPLADAVEAVLFAAKERRLVAGADKLIVEEAEVKETVREGISIPEEVKKERETLRMGSEGKDVREMQDGTNGAPVVSVRKFAEIQETVIKEAGDAEIDISQHRVFLLGENRWEEPSRVQRRNKPVEPNKASFLTQCLTCRGEGRLMCSECDGTGEPNIEPQVPMELFLVSYILYYFSLGTFTCIHTTQCLSSDFDPRSLWISFIFASTAYMVHSSCSSRLWPRQLMDVIHSRHYGLCGQQLS